MSKNIILILFTLAFFGFSCTDGSMDIFIDQNENDSQNAVLIDTMRIESYTLKTDSIANSATGNILAGSVNMNNLITIHSDAYFQLALPGSTFGSYNITGKTVIDSAVLHLNYTDFVGDTTKVQSYSLHQVLETIPLNESQTSNSTYAFDSSALATFSFKPRPIKDTSIDFTFDPELTKKIFEYYQSLSSSDSPDITKVLKGLVLKGGSENSTVHGFSAANSRLRIYTHTEETFTKTHFDFPISTNNAQFNHIDYVSIYDGLNNLVNPEAEISSTKTGQSILLNNGLGLAGKIVIPGISTLKEMTNLNGIFRVELKLYSTRKNIFEVPFPPTNLELYQINLNNQVTGTVVGQTGNPIGGTYTYMPNELVFASYYVFDLTQYYKDVISGTIKNKGIMVRPTNNGYNSSRLNGVWLGDAENPSFKPEIKVYFNR